MSYLGFIQVNPPGYTAKTRGHFASYSAAKSCAQAHALDHAHWKL